jgi:hypothetical protein
VISAATAGVIMAAWRQGSFFVIGLNEQPVPRLYVESPEEAGAISKGKPRESYVRVFATETEARRYRDAVMEYSGIELSIIETNLKTIFAGADSINKSVAPRHSSTVRVELCVMPENEHAQGIDTLWSAQIWRN